MTEVSVTLSLWVPPLFTGLDAEEAEAQAAAATAAADAGSSGAAPALAEAPPEPPPQDPVSVAEADAPRFFAASPRLLRRYSEQEGAVLISFGSITAGFADTLLWLVPALCLDAVTSVLDTGTATFNLFGSDTVVELRRDGDDIEITADIMDPTRFPAMPLLAALAEAGERLVVLAGTLWPDDRQALRALPRLAAQAATLRARLAAPDVLHRR